MRVRVLIGLIFLLGVPATIFMVRLQRAQEVIVAGKPVVAWALELDGPGNTTTAENVFRKVGPKAAANLIQALEQRDSLLKTPLQRLAPHLPTSMRVGLFRTVDPQEAERLRLAAVAALALMGQKATSAVPALGKALRDANPGVSMRSGMALGRMGHSALPELLKAMKDTNVQARKSAIYGLSLAGTEAQPAVPTLIGALEDTNPEIRERAFEALSQIRHPSTVSALTAKLSHPQAGVRVLIVRCLAGMGPWAREAISVLIEATADPNSDVRQSVMEALGKIRPAAEPVVQALAKALSDPRPNVRAEAAKALIHSGPAAALTVPSLIDRLSDEDHSVRTAAAEALGAVGASASSALPALSQASEDADPNVSAKARQAAGEIQQRLRERSK